MIPEGGWWRSVSERMFFEMALASAPTVLENYFWGFLFGACSAEQYFEELMITDLVGPGDVPDDFSGEENR